MIVATSGVADSTGATPVFMVSTVADLAANNTSRADLVIDKGHAILGSALVKITDNADLTVTVTTGGWAPAVGNSLTFSFLQADGSTAHLVTAVPDLQPDAQVI